MIRLNNFPTQPYYGYYWEDRFGNLSMGSKYAPEFPIEGKKSDEIIARQIRAANYLAKKRNLF